MTAFHEIIKRPLVTEKSMADRGFSRYAFEVATRASKPAIREAIQGFFKVKVVSVRTLHVHGRRRRHGQSVGMSPSWKKAIVTLAAGQRIDVLEVE